MKIEISEETAKTLDELSNQSNLSKEELLKEAIQYYNYNKKYNLIYKHNSISEKNSTIQESQDEKEIDRAFGMWKDRNIDSLEYQRRMRDEWEGM